MSADGNSEDTNVRVAVRCRPFNTKEKNNNEVSCVQIRGEKVVLVNPLKPDDEHSFAFDIVIDEKTAQSTVWNQVGVPILQKAFSGYNGTIFAYGQTGSGKTWSMQGADGDLRGIIPRMNSNLFQRIQEETAKRPTMQFLVTVSYFEIYNEVIFDLLDASDRKKKNHAAHKGGLEIKEHPVLGVYVKGLQEIVTDSEAKLQSIIDQGMRNRTTASTQMNADSSRSHSVFMINLHQKDSEDESKNVFAKVNLVDLAGSERVKSTGATGSTLKEGANINKSLSALGNVINALVEASKGKGVFIPYRNSKLTRVLQESLGGNSITAMLAAMSPAASNFEETLSTLKYANRAKAIKVKAVKNEESSQISRLNDEIRLLKEKLAQGGDSGGGSGGGSGGSGNNADLSALEEKNLQQLRDLEEARKRTWEEKSKMSKEYEQERKKMLLGQQAAARQLESARQRNWALLEQKGDLDITLGHVRTLLSDRNVTGNASAVLSAWSDEHKAAVALERSLAAQDTVMQIYRSTLTKDSHAFMELTLSKSKSRGADGSMITALDSAVVGALRQLRDKFIAADSEVSKWTAAQDALVDKLDSFSQSTRSIGSLAELLHGRDSNANSLAAAGITTETAAVAGGSNVSLNEIDEKELLRGLRLIVRQSRDKWNSIQMAVAQSRRAFLDFDTVIADLTKLLSFYSAATQQCKSLLTSSTLRDGASFTAAADELLQHATASANVISQIVAMIDSSIARSSKEAVQRQQQQQKQQRGFAEGKSGDGAMTSGALSTAIADESVPIDAATVVNCDFTQDVISMNARSDSAAAAISASTKVSLNNGSGIPISNVAVDADNCWCGSSAAALTLSLPAAAGNFRLSALVLQGGINPSPAAAVVAADLAASILAPQQQQRATALPCGVSLSSCDGSIELTAAALGDVMDWSNLLKSNPPEKFLKRPPVRFLFDLVHFIAQSNPGFMPAALADVDWAAVGQDKNTKLDFMSQLIEFVTSVAKQSKPIQEAAAIVTGSNPELTNALLQQLAIAVHCFQQKIEVVASSDSKTSSGSLSGSSNSKTQHNAEALDTWMTQCTVEVSEDGGKQWRSIGTFSTGLSARDQAATITLPVAAQSVVSGVRIVPVEWSGKANGLRAAMRVQLLGVVAQKSQQKQTNAAAAATAAETKSAGDPETSNDHQMLAVESSLLVTVLSQLLQAIDVMIDAVNRISRADDAIKEHKQKEVKQNMENLAKEKLALEELLAREKQSLESNNQDLAEQLKNCLNQLRETKQLLEKEQIMSQELDETCKQLREGKQTAENALAEKENENSQLKTDILKLQANHEKDTKTIADQQQLLKEQEAALETAKEQLQQADEAHAAVEQERDDLQSQCNVLTEERDAARAQEEDLFEKLTDRTNDLERLQESYVNIADRCNDAQDEAMDLREQLESLQEAFATRAALQSVLPAAPAVTTSSMTTSAPGATYDAMPKKQESFTSSSSSNSPSKSQAKDPTAAVGAKMASPTAALAAEAKSLNGSKSASKLVPIDKKPSASDQTAAVSDYNDDFDDYEDEFEADD